MNAVQVMLKLLRAHVPLTALVPTDCIVAGTIGQGHPLPAVSVSEVSRNEFATVAQDDPSTWVRSRVQITVHAKDYPAQKAILLAAKLGAGVHAGKVAGVKVRSVRRLSVGPDFSDDDAGIYQQSRDFMVTYLEPN